MTCGGGEHYNIYICICHAHISRIRFGQIIRPPAFSIQIAQPPLASQSLKCLYSKRRRVAFITFERLYTFKHNRIYIYLHTHYNCRVQIPERFLTTALPSPSLFSWVLDFLAQNILYVYATTTLGFIVVFTDSEKFDMRCGKSWEGGRVPSQNALGVRNLVSPYATRDLSYVYLILYTIFSYLYQIISTVSTTNSFRDVHASRLIISHDILNTKSPKQGASLPF